MSFESLQKAKFGLRPGQDNGQRRELLFIFQLVLILTNVLYGSGGRVIFCYQRFKSWLILSQHPRSIRRLSVHKSTQLLVMLHRAGLRFVGCSHGASCWVG